MQEVVKANTGSRAKCPRDIQTGRKQVVVRMTRDELRNQPRGWLTTWTEDLEAGGCIAPGEAIRLASALAQSMPLEMNAAFQLLYSNDRNVVKLRPGIRLQVMTPIMTEGTDPNAPIIEASTTTVNGNVVNIDGRMLSDWWLSQSNSESPTHL